MKLHSFLFYPKILWSQFPAVAQKNDIGYFYMPAAPPSTAVAMVDRPITRFKPTNLRIVANIAPDPGQS